MTRQNYTDVKKNSEYAINDNSIKEVLSSKQKRFFNKLEFSNVEYDLIYSENSSYSYLKQKITITTRENKKVSIYLYVKYDLDKKEYFCSEKNTEILDKIDDAISDFNEDLSELNDVISRYTEDYKQETPIKLLNNMSLNDIKSFINNYYRIQKETNSSFNLEQLVDTLDLF